MSTTPGSAARYLRYAPEVEQRQPGEAEDVEVQVCPANGWTLITSRNPDDVPAFADTIVKTLT